ncbi:MAG: 50S ribosomal protein L10 [Candidatus Kappaea frigidicola]|nr:50S ribosomal protein L10 [Candidatus Kappaea frigidicola]
MGRLEREFIVDEISKRIKVSENIILSNFSKIKAEQLNDLRSKLADNQSSYFVVKNTLCKLALEKADKKQLIDLINGPTGFVFCGDNPIATSKVIVDFSKTAEGLEVLGGIIDGEILAGGQVKELASLPSHKELLTMVVTGLKSPITSFVGVLGQLVKSFVVVLNEVAKKKEQETLAEAVTAEASPQEPQEASTETAQEEVKMEEVKEAVDATEAAVDTEAQKEQIDNENDNQDKEE